MREWWATPAGEALITLERDALASIVDGVFGHHGLELSSAHESPNFLSRSAVVGRFRGLLSGQGWISGDFAARPVEWPFQDNSLRLVVLHHVLEQVSDHKTLIGEIARVLAPEGVLVTVVFNRASLWGAVRRLRWFCAPPAYAGYLGMHSLTRRLRDVGVSPVFQRYLAHGLPRRNPRPNSVLSRVGARVWNQFGASCVLVARKHQEGTTPLKLKKAEVTRGLPAAAGGLGAWCEQAGRRNGGER